MYKDGDSQRAHWKEVSYCTRHVSTRVSPFSLLLFWFRSGNSASHWTSGVLSVPTVRSCLRLISFFRSGLNKSHYCTDVFHNLRMVGRWWIFRSFWQWNSNALRRCRGFREGDDTFFFFSNATSDDVCMSKQVATSSSPTIMHAFFRSSNGLLPKTKTVFKCTRCLCTIAKVCYFHRYSPAFHDSIFLSFWALLLGTPNRPSAEHIMMLELAFRSAVAISSDHFG